MMTSRESGDLTKIQDDRSLFQFSNLSNIVCMKNVSYVFKVKISFSNLSGVVLTGPKTNINE